MAQPTNSETLIRSPGALGLAIRQRRKAQQLRIDDAAALCGVSADLLSRLENGRSGVGSDKLLKVFAGLGLEFVIVPAEHLSRLVSNAPPR